MPKLKIATSKTHTRPHFASHTQSSLMKTRTPMKMKKLSSIKNVNESKKSQKSMIPKLNGIYKQRNSITKQSRSMLIMILKQQVDRRATVFLPDDELTGTTCQLENSLISFQCDLIKDVSRDLKNCVGSPAKLATFRDEQTKVINEFESCTKDLHNSSQDGINCAKRDNSDDTHNASEARAIVDVTCKLQLHLSDEEEPVNLRCEVEDLHRRTESGEKPDDFSNKDCTEMQVHPQGVNVTTNRKCTQKTWAFRKVRTQNEHVNINRTYRTDLQDSETTRYVGTVANNDAIIRKRSALQKNLIFNQRAWRPPSVSKNFTKSTTSLLPISQKSSQLAEKSIASTKSKHLSTECIKSFNSKSTSTSENQSKTLMKENKDPRANRMTKICEHLTETKQRQRLQNGRTLPKKKQSKTKIPSKVLHKCDDTNLTLTKSKSRQCQTRSIIPKEFSNNIEQHRIGLDVIHTLEVIDTLKKIIDSVKENDDAEENVKKNDIDYEKDIDKSQMSPNNDTLQNDELHIFAKDINLDEADESSRRSISTQTKLDFPSYHEIDAEKDQDLTEILNLTRIVATQTLPSCNRNVVEIGCDTSAIIYNDVEVSCDLIGSTNLKTEIESTTIEDKSTSNVHTEPSSIKHVKVDVENEDINENKELLLSECKKTLNTETKLKLENYDSMEIPIKSTNNAAEEIEKNEKVCQISLKPLKNSDDKINTDIDEKQEFTKCFNNHNVNSTSINNLLSERSRSSICDYDASCSSEEIVEYLENNIQYKDMVSSESKVEDIPSDVIAAFELAAKHARNLHEAVIIYHKNLISKESEKRNEEKVEDYETSEFRDEQNCFETYASFISRENENKIRSECEAICHFVNNEDFGGFSTCSSRRSSSDQISEIPRSSKNDYFRIEQEENVFFSGNEQARSILSEFSDLEDVKSLMQLLVRRTPEEYALELLESDRNNESFEMEKIKSDKILALPAATKKTSLISREYLLPFIYCIIYTVVFWYLQFSFRCDSTK